MHSLFATEGPRAIEYSPDFWVGALIKRMMNTSPPNPRNRVQALMLVFGAPNYLNLLTYSLLTPEHPTGKGHERGKAGDGTRKQVTGAVSARGRRRLQKSHPGRVARGPEWGQRASVTAACSQVGPGKTWGWSPHYTSCHTSRQPRGGLGARRARVALTPPN